MKLRRRLGRRKEFTSYRFVCPIDGCRKELGGPVRMETLASREELERIKLSGLEYHARTKKAEHQCIDPEALLEWIDEQREA